MSDGNFNTQLLPKTELSSGLRAGKAQMRVKAEKAFDTILSTHFPQLTPEQATQIKAEFMELIRN